MSEALKGRGLKLMGGGLFGVGSGEGETQG